jgi:hypothetical protein
MGLWRGKVLLTSFIGLWIVASLAMGLPRLMLDPAEVELRRLLVPSAGCPQPCWETIRPNVTSSTEAIARLNTMPWVTNITAIQGIVTNDSIIRWEWNGQQSPVIDGERGGTIWLHNGLVYSIELPLKVTYAKVWQAIGKPDYTTYTKAPREKPTVEYHVLYAEGLMDFYGEIRCPLRAWTLFSMPVDAHFASERQAQSGRETQAICK